MMVVTNAVTPDVSLAPKLIGVPTPFFILAIVAFVTRIVIRIRRKRIGIDDVSLAAGMVIEIVKESLQKESNTSFIRHVP
jgi:hypothetical protein